MSWIRNAVSRAVEVGAKNSLARSVRDYAEFIQDRIVILFPIVNVVPCVSILASMCQYIAMPILCVPSVIFPRCSVLIYMVLFSSVLEFYFEVLHQGPPNLRRFKQAVKRLEEVAVSCRGLERVQLLRRWLVALKEVERLSSDSKGKHEKSSIELLASDESKDSPTKPTSVRTKPGFVLDFYGPHL